MEQMTGERSGEVEAEEVQDDGAGREQKSKREVPHMWNLSGRLSVMAGEGA